ncbi:MAG: VWA domain-containing protein [Acidobacteria bacterium]|nr:VWA domain-containing protein [Acidobacteriota bacterium]
MKAIVIAAGLLAMSGTTMGTVVPRVEEKPRIQIAILLDTSNSMDGLIDQAKTQLWRVVNELATAKRSGKAPELQVALYEYGNTSIPAETGYVRMVLPLSSDLDKVSEQLFALRTNGGDEYCGQVIQYAAKNLAWSSSNADFKAIFIAGNEPFTQGGINYQIACRDAIAKGIIVNTIFCGGNDEGVNTKWKDGADLADGRYMSIDQNAVAVHVDAPQDKKIAELGAALNQTYIAYGAAGEASKQRQAEQDVNASAAAPGANTQRQLAKASALYTNEAWDLVDAKKAGTKVEEMKEAELPAEMKKMNVEARKAYVDAKAKERERLQAEIKKLNGEREKFVADEMKKNAASGKNTLDAAIVKAVREEAAKKNFQFE